jgi:Lipase (class 3)
MRRTCDLIPVTATFFAAAAYISYPLSFLIREAKRGALRRSGDVLERLEAIRDGDLSTALQPHEVREIVRDNMEHIARHPQNDFDDRHGWYSVLEHWSDVTTKRPGSISLLEFDDHGEAHRLVYGILVNRIRRRITVVFRGTYADGTDDWRRNLQFDLVEIPVPYNLQPILRRDERGQVTEDLPLEAAGTADPTESNVDRDSYGGTTDNHHHHGAVPTMRIHHGLYEYLFDNSARGPKYQQERYEEILGHLQRILRENPGFKIYVAGHSLGGALAKFFAFYLSTSRQALQIPKPVTCVALGSLLLGDAGFQRAFHCVERLGWIRHLRITNDGDPVCSLPPLDEYRPSGMHLSLRRQRGHVLWHPSGRGGVEHRNDNSWRSLMGVLRSSIIQGTDLFQDHLVPAYLRRLEREKESLQKRTLNELYRDPELVGTDDYSNQF